jgi:hypothetical protein
MQVIGLLSGASPASFALFESAFRKGLADAGFVHGKNLAFEYRWAEGQFERLPSLAVDLIGQGPAMIVTHTFPFPRHRDVVCRRNHGHEIARSLVTIEAPTPLPSQCATVTRVAVTRGMDCGRWQNSSEWVLKLYAVV